LKLLDYKKPESMEEAYSLYELEGSEIIGGGAWLKLGNQTKALGIDLEKLGLNKIEDKEDGIYIGAMTNLYQLEESEILKDVYSGIISLSASKIMGVQVRNIATIGGTVCGKYGFSDLITPLLAIGAKLKFYKAGVMTLEEFMAKKGKNLDILTDVIIPKAEGNGCFETFKKTSIDFAVVNMTVVKSGNQISIAVGARPGVAKVNRIEIEEVIKQREAGTPLHDISAKVISEFNFGANHRASKEYRIR